MNWKNWVFATIALVIVAFSAYFYARSRVAKPKLEAGKSTDPYQHGFSITGAGAVGDCTDNCDIVIYQGSTSTEVRLFWKVVSSTPPGHTVPDPAPVMRGVVCPESGTPQPDFAQCSPPFDITLGEAEGLIPVQLNDFMQDPYSLKASLQLWVGAKPQFSEPSPGLALMAQTMTRLHVIHQ